MTDRRYEHFSRGDVVRINKPWRQLVGDYGDPAHYYIDHPAGEVGTVRDMSNAGFAGLLYQIVTGDGVSAYNIPAAELELLAPVPGPIAPWPTTSTYRDGKRITYQVERRRG